MPRSYCPQLHSNDTSVLITDRDEIHHLRVVLGVREGEDLELFTGRGVLAHSKIQSVSKKVIGCSIQRVEEVPCPLPKITLACAVPKRSKFETIIEKATELGASQMIPMITRRTEVKFKAETLSKKMDRYYQVAMNALKQCKRLWLPQIETPTSLEEVLVLTQNFDQVLIPCLQGERTPLLQALEPGSKSILILIGPEGDFEDEELELARRSQAKGVTLGPNILKVETAALLSLGTVALFYN